MSIRLKGSQLNGINAAIKTGNPDLVDAEIQKAARMADPAMRPIKKAKPKISSKKRGSTITGYKLKLRRLKVGEKIMCGDWCCDPRTDPVRVISGGAVLSEHHHPFYRLEW